MRHLSVLAWVMLVLLVVPSCPIRAQEKLNQYMLADQHDWAAKTGFYLIVHNTYTGDGPASLDKAVLAIGVGDGQNWNIRNVEQKWEFDRDYVAKAVIAPAKAQLYLDGAIVAEFESKLLPHAGPLLAAQQAPWAIGPADYRVRQTGLKVGAGDQEPREIPIPISDVPPALTLFQASTGVSVPFVPAGTNTFIATFRIERMPGLRELAPFIDRYGQSIHAEFDGKVRTDEDLTRAMQEEEQRLSAWGEPAGFDRFGGVRTLGWSEEPSGYFRVVQRDGFWWLVSPEGHPCFYRGVCTAPAVDWDATPVTGREYLFEWLPPRAGPMARSWRFNPWGRPDERSIEYISPHTPNLVRKYGDDWEAKAVASTFRRLKVWGFSGLGKWSSSDVDIPRMPVLHLGDVPRIGRHPDVFDEKIVAHIERVLRAQIEPQRTSPWIIGWSIGNEYDAMPNADDLRAALEQGADVPIKRALVDHALSELYANDIARLSRAWNVQAHGVEQLCAARPTLPTEDLERLRQFWADRYMALLYATVKRIDPNHLYFGNWVTPNWWVNENDWWIVARHCDVMGYDQYNLDFAGGHARRLIDGIDKPVLLGEFSFPPDHDGQRGYGRYGTFVHSEQEVADTYTRYLAQAAADPKCVGVMWFQYRDQPLTGRGPVEPPMQLVHGEHFAFGLVDVTDRPKWTIVQAMRDANLQADRQRQAAMSASAARDR